MRLSVVFAVVLFLLGCASDPAKREEVAARFTALQAKVISEIDRALLNLNNGGICPAPAVVQNAVKRYLVATDNGRFSCQSLVVATGGLAIPKIGASPFGYRLAEQFGIPVVAPKPALVPLALAPEVLDPIKPLAGATLDATALFEQASFRENVLITHPAVLESAIVGVPDEKWGEVGHAFILLRADGPGVTDAEVIQFCRANVAGYKTPRHVTFVDEFPRTAAGKIRKHMLAPPLPAPAR